MAKSDLQINLIDPVLIPCKEALNTTSSEVDKEHQIAGIWTELNSWISQFSFKHNSNNGSNNFQKDNLQLNDAADGKSEDVESGIISDAESSCDCDCDGGVCQYYDLEYNKKSRPISLLTQRSFKKRSVLEVPPAIGLTFIIGFVSVLGLVFCLWVNLYSLSNERMRNGQGSLAAPNTMPNWWSPLPYEQRRMREYSFNRNPLS